MKMNANNTVTVPTPRISDVDAAVVAFVTAVPGLVAVRIRS